MKKLSMPKSYYGEEARMCGRLWTDKEIRWCELRRKDGYTVEEIAEGCNRSNASVHAKFAQIDKENEKHFKYRHDGVFKTSNQFIKDVNAKTILHLGSGRKQTYWKFKKDKKYTVVSNDIEVGLGADYQMEAFDVLVLSLYQKNRFDVIDIDIPSATYQYIEPALMLAQKGVAIKIPEYVHRRFKRFDNVRYTYGITNKDDFTLETIINHIQMLGLRHNKPLELYAIEEWNGLAKVWFAIK